MPTSSVSLTVAIGEPANLYLPADPQADLSVSAALNYLKLKPGSTVTISDTCLNIQKNLSTLQSLNGRITAVKSSEDSKILSVTYKELQNDKGILSKWSNNAVHQFDFTDITATAASLVWNQDSTYRMAIKDTAINIQNNLSNLLDIDSKNNNKIASVTQLNTSALITLSTSKFLEAENFFRKINKGVNNFAITNASVDDVISSLAVKSSIKSISIVDTTDNIDININALRVVGMKIKTIEQNNTQDDKVLDLTAAEIKANSSVLGKIITGYQLAAQNTAATQLSSLISNRKVISIEVKDTAVNISRNWDSINRYSGSVNKIEVLEVTNSTNTINIKASQLANSKALINKFPPPVLGVDSFKINVSEASASQASDLSNSNEISSFDIRDTAENIGKYISELSSGESKIKFIKTANSSQIEMSYSTYSNMSGILSKINKGAYNLKLKDLSVDDLIFITSPVLDSNILFDDKSISSVEIVDSVDKIEDNLSLLNSVGSRLRSISIDYPPVSVNDSTLVLTPLTIEAQDFLKNQRALEKIVGGYKVDITKSTVKQALSLATNTNVQSIDIEDNAVNISSSWNKLIDINSQLDDVYITGTSISITADQYDRGIDASFQTKISDSIPVRFAIKNASIEKALDLIEHDRDELISSIEIKDTGENITDNFVALKDLFAQNTIDTKLYQLDPRNSLEISYSDLSEYNDVLNKINGQGYKLTINGATVSEALTATINAPLSSTTLKYRNITSVNIVDTSLQIGSNFNSLLLMGKKLSSISLDNLDGSLINTAPLDNIAISYNQYISGKYVLDRINDNYNLEIKDAAVYNAPSLSKDTHIQAISVYGTASYISKAWDVLSGIGSQLKNIYNTTTLAASSVADKINTSINLSVTQWLSSSNLLSKLAESVNKNFTIYDASISNAALIMGGSNSSLIKNIKIQDNAESIDAAFGNGTVGSDELLTTVLQNSLISDISVINPSKPIELTYTQFSANNNQVVFEKIGKYTDGSVVKNDFLLNIDNVKAEEAISISTKSSTPSYVSNINLIDISDDSSNIQDYFESLKSISKLNTISLENNDAELTLTATNVLDLDSIRLLKKIVDDVSPNTPPTYLNHPYTLNITDVSMSQLDKLHSWDSSTDGPTESMLDSELLPLVRDYYLSDYADNITSSFNKLTALGGNLKGFSFLNAGVDGNNTDINISYNQWMASKDHLDSLAVKPSSYYFNLTDVTASDAVGGDIVTTNSDGTITISQATPVFEDARLSDGSVKELGKVKSVVVKDAPSAIAANWTLLNAEYEKINSKLSSLIFTIPNHGPRTLELTAAQVIKVKDEATLQKLFEQVTSTNPVVIRDTSANIATYWDALTIVYGSGTGSLGNKLSAIDPTDDFGVNITDSQLTPDSRKLILDKLDGNYYSIKVDGEWYPQP